MLMRLPPRIIPTLLLKNRSFVKGLKFKNHKYVGDPLNIIKLFNDLQASEILIMGIDARENNGPDFDYLNRVSSQAFMPMSYGGNINNVLLVPDYVANNTLELDGGEGFHNPFFNISNIVIKYHENNQMHFRDGVNGSISYQGYANVIADPGTNIGIDTLVNLNESIFDWTHYGQNY